MTGYVATRWYRAPEIMLNWMHYRQTGMFVNHGSHASLKVLESSRIPPPSRAWKFWKSMWVLEF